MSLLSDHLQEVTVCWNVTCAEPQLQQKTMFSGVKVQVSDFVCPVKVLVNRQKSANTFRTSRLFLSALVRSQVCFGGQTFHNKLSQKTDFCLNMFLLPLMSFPASACMNKSLQTH